MVFLSAVLIYAVLHFLPTEGLIYVTIIALIGEGVNIFMAQTMSKAAETKATMKFAALVKKNKQQILTLKRTVKDLEDVQEEYVRKVMASGQKIKAYEEKFGPINTPEPPPEEKKVKTPATDTKKEKSIEKPRGFADLPPGSNRKDLPI